MSRPRIRRVLLLAGGAVAVAVGAGALVATGPDGRPGPAVAAPDPACATDPAAAGHQHTHAFAHPPDPAAGLRSTGAGIRLDLDRAVLPAGTETAVELRLTQAGTAARLVRTGDVPMHVYLVRTDLAGYQHVHPTATPDCGWRVRLRPPAPGRYRLFAEFRPRGRADTDPDVVLSRPLTVPGRAVPTPLPPPDTRVQVDGYTLAQRGYTAAGGESLLVFSVSRAGRPVRTLSPYLGELAHVSVFRDGTLAFNHAHPLQPLTSTGPLLTTPLIFPGAGTYRVFVQFVADGRLHSAALTVSVR